MDKLITSEHLSNIKFAADCAIKEPDSIYSQEFFMLLDETFGSKGDYESPTQAVAVAWLINRVNELEQRAEAAEAKFAELAKQPPAARVMLSGSIVDLPEGADLSPGTELYTRPAPAAVPVDLVPDLIHSQGEKTAYHDYFSLGWNACRAEMLHRIERLK